MKLYNNDEPFECDITASALKFYTKNNNDDFEIPIPKYLFDVCPQSEEIKQIIPFQKLPLESNSVGSIVFDPPFVISPKTCKSATEGKENSCLMYKRFSSFYPVSELYYNYYWWIQEAYRTLKEDGIFVVKCMSTVSGGYQHNSEEFVFMAAMDMGFYCVDKFILNSKARLISSSKYKKQCHARKYTSVFYVFQKSPKMLKKYNYFELINKMKESNLEGMVWELK
jgi:DNA modification methylase